MLLRLVIDGLIQDLNLPISAGGALAGWSMGNIYTLATLNSTEHPSLLQESKDRLKAFLRTRILWGKSSIRYYHQWQVPIKLTLFCTFRCPIDEYRP